MSNLLTGLRAWLSALSRREQILVATVGGLAVVVVLYGAVALPFLSAGSSTRERAATAERELAEMWRLRKDFDEINGRLQEVERRIERAPRGNIFTSLESLASQSAIGSKVHSMERRASTASDRYRETRVELDLRAISLAEFVSYLDRIVSSPQPLSVKSLHIRTRADQPDLLDVRFSVSSFEPL